MKLCRCGCGEAVKGARVFVNKEHQLRWMVGGGAAELNTLQPLEAKSRGGRTMGEAALKSGRLLEASRKGAAKVRAISSQFRIIRSRGKP
jgi:hypothetical protein